MRTFIRLALIIALISPAALNAGWLVGEETEKAFQEFLKNARDNGIKNIRFDSDDIKKAADTSTVTLQNLKISLDQTNKTFKEFSDNSLLNKNNAHTFERSCAFTTLGLFICCCGTTLLYTACNEICAKINAEEHKDSSVQEMLSWRDFVKPALGLAALGIGYTIIVR